jgi:methionine aminopeptidase
MILVGPFDVTSLANHNLGLRWRRATQFTITNSKIVGYQKGAFSMESNETAQAYKDGVSKFQNNEVQAYDPLLNFKSTSAVITAADMKVKALTEGNKEVSYTKAEMETLSKPIWINGWTRFPTKGN